METDIIVSDKKHKTVYANLQEINANLNEGTDASSTPMKVKE